MTLDRCPTLQSVTRQRGHAVTLTASTGRTFTALKADRVIFAPDLALLTVKGRAYRVPVHLFDAVRRAFDLKRVEA